MPNSTEKIVFAALILLMFASQAMGASRVTLPLVSAPQDTVDAAVPIPDVGVSIALVNYNSLGNSATFAVIKDGVVVAYEASDNIALGASIDLLDNCSTYVSNALPSIVELIVSCPIVEVVANSIDLNLSSDFISFIEDNGIYVKVASAQDFNRDYDTIIILGGPDAPEGVGDIVQTVLSQEDQEYLRIQGNNEMFVRKNPWWARYGHKTITVIAGSDRQETLTAILENQGRLFHEIEVFIEFRKLA
jgi:hypothetical protein